MGFFEGQFRVGERVCVSKDRARYQWVRFAGWSGTITGSSRGMKALFGDVADYAYYIKFDGVDPSHFSGSSESVTASLVKKINRDTRSVAFPGAVLVPTTTTMLLRKMEGRWVPSSQLLHVDEIPQDDSSGNKGGRDRRHRR